VGRERDLKDRRVMTVSLSTRGHELIELLMPRHVQNVLSVFAALSPGELTQLAALSKKLGLSLQAEG